MSFFSSLFHKSPATLSQAQEIMVYVKQLLEDYEKEDYHVAQGKESVTNSIWSQIANAHFSDFNDSSVNDKIRYASLLIHEHSINLLTSGQFCVMGTTLTFEGNGIMSIFRLNGQKGIALGELTPDDLSLLIKQIHENLKCM